MTIITLLTLISIGGVDVVVKTNTTDVLTFIKGEALELHATMYNFSQNDSNLSILTTPSATLVANDNTNSATNTYNVYLIIEENGILYPIEIKKSANPTLSMTKAFKVLDKEIEKKRGQGAIVCLYDKKVLFREDVVVLPIEYI